MVFSWLNRGIVCLPEQTDEGYHVILCKLIDPQSSKFVFNDAVKLWVLQKHFNSISF